MFPLPISVVRVSCFVCISGHVWVEHGVFLTLCFVLSQSLWRSLRCRVSRRVVQMSIRVCGCGGAIVRARIAGCPMALALTQQQHAEHIYCRAFTASTSLAKGACTNRSAFAIERECFDECHEGVWDPSPPPPTERSERVGSALQSRRIFERTSRIQPIGIHVV